MMCIVKNWRMWHVIMGKYILVVEVVAPSSGKSLTFLVFRLNPPKILT